MVTVDEGLLHIFLLLVKTVLVKLLTNRLHQLRHTRPMLLLYTET